MLGATPEPEPDPPVPPPLTPPMPTQQALVVGVFTITGPYMALPGKPALSKKIKFMHQLDPHLGEFPSLEHIQLQWVNGFLAQMTRPRNMLGGFGLTLDSFLTLTGGAAALKLTAARTAGQGGDLSLEDDALQPWRDQLVEMARVVAFHHASNDIKEHAHAAWAAFHGGHFGRGLTRLLHAARIMAVGPQHGGCNSAMLLGWIGEALEVCRLRRAFPEASIYWLNALVDVGLPYDILLQTEGAEPMEIDVKLSTMKLHRDPARPPQKPNPTREVGIEVDLGQSEALWRAGGPTATRRIVRVYAWAASWR